MKNYALYVGHSKDQNFGDWFLYEIIKKALTPLNLLAYDRIVLQRHLQALTCKLWSVGLLPKCDISILGGGTIMMPTKRYHLNPLLGASRRHWSIGTGAKSVQERLAFKLLTKDECSRQADTYSGFERLSVRGPLSLESLRDAGVERDIEVVGDPFLDLFDPNQSMNNTCSKDVLLNVADLDSTQGHYWAPQGTTVQEAYGRIIDSLTQAGYSPRLVVCAPVDASLALRLAKRHALPDPVVALNMAELDKLFQVCGKVIATRLHFMIYSVLRGVPTASLNYQDKHLDFWLSVLPQKSFSRLSQIKTANWLEEFERAWAEFGIHWDSIRSRILCLNKQRAGLYDGIRAHSHACSHN